MEKELDKQEHDSDEELIFNPYNLNNVEVTRHDIETILKKYGLPPRITNFELWRRAFIHRSYTKRPEAENELNEIKIAQNPWMLATFHKI